jgi:hypothetical protein
VARKRGRPPGTVAYPELDDFLRWLIRAHAETHQPWSEFAAQLAAELANPEQLRLAKLLGKGGKESPERGIKRMLRRKRRAILKTKPPA